MTVCLCVSVLVEHQNHLVFIFVWSIETCFLVWPRCLLPLSSLRCYLMGVEASFEHEWRHDGVTFLRWAGRVCVCVFVQESGAFLGSCRWRWSVRSCRRDSGSPAFHPALTHISVSQEATHPPRSRCGCCIQGVGSLFHLRICDYVRLFTSTAVECFCRFQQ